MVDSIPPASQVGSIGEVRRIAELCELNAFAARSRTGGEMVGDAAAGISREPRNFPLASSASSRCPRRSVFDCQ